MVTVILGWGSLIWDDIQRSIAREENAERRASLETRVFQNLWTKEKRGIDTRYR